MCKMMEDMRNEAVRADKVANALTMLADGLSYEKVAKYSGLTIEEVRMLGQKKSA